ncbi:MAG: tRNA-dihydrouridine synthase family protein [Candidatus Helarchaeota archaeon]
MNIKKLNLVNETILAPLTDFNDHAFLLLCRKYNASLLFTQKYDINALINNFQKFEDELKTYKKERPIFIQLIGNDPQKISRAIEMLESFDYDGYDLNLGCNSPNSIKNNIGGALLRTPAKIGAIINKMVQSTNKFVSAKIRIGFDRYSINALEVAKTIEKSGADFLTIHGRTVEAGYSGKSNLDIIKYVKENVDIPVIGNGDIIDGPTAELMKKYTKCDLLMIGRAAIGYPRIFYEINYYFRNHKLSRCSKDLYKKILIEYYLLLKKVYPEKTQNLSFLKNKLTQFIRPKLCRRFFKSAILEQNTILGIENLILNE